MPPSGLLLPARALATLLRTRARGCVRAPQHVLPKLPGMSQPRPWFDHGGVPLRRSGPSFPLPRITAEPLPHTRVVPRPHLRAARSSLPVGVLFDLLSPLDGGGGGGGSEQDASSLPWQLVLHYTHAPGETSVSWLASLPPHTVFMNSLKASCAR